MDALTALPRPDDHPLRAELNAEVHARPPESLRVPLRVSYLALHADAAQRAEENRLVAELAARCGIEPPLPNAPHFSRDFGAFRLKYERHTEFSRWVFIVHGAGPAPFVQPALSHVPSDWIARLPGRTLIATHAELLAHDGSPLDYDAVSTACFDGNNLVGGEVADGAATVLTDVRVRADGYSRLLLLNRGMKPRQTGRMLQRLFEIDTYRLMALLALPVARELAPFLNETERELAQVTTALIECREEDEPALFDRLTRLEAAIESRIAGNDYRFAAAAAYNELVQRRIDELREVRLEGLQTFREFTERRLAPAMNTCRAMARRQHSLSERVARASALLSTRVGISRERQNQALLESMNRRAQAQLRLQQTVEGLSVAAITYYVVGLLAYAAEALRSGGVPIDPAVAVGVSIPIVALLIALSVRRLRRRIVRA
ncbi:MAG: DUF3422 domain-containing protein [Steroidobacteraceae bacterium]|jgi:uncharacterized membrane-anchored protein|nr:DUF3422 domain-containing protein [Steroidobacteraceae bacterium]